MSRGRGPSRVVLLLLAVAVRCSAQDVELQERGGGRRGISWCPPQRIIPPPPIVETIIEEVDTDGLCCIADPPTVIRNVFPFFETGCPTVLDTTTVCEAVETLPGLVAEHTRLLGTNSEADTSVVGSAIGCFDVFATGKPPVSETCFNEFIGTSALVLSSMLFDVSILTVGDVVIDTTPESIDLDICGKVHILGDLLVTQNNGAAIDVCSDPDNCGTSGDNPLTRFGVYLGGRANKVTVPSASTPFLRNPEGTVAIANVADAEAIVGDFQFVIPADQVLFAKQTAVARLCSGAMQIGARGTSGNASVTDGALTIQCDDGNLDTCIIDLAPQLMEQATSIASVDLGGYNTAVVRVGGVGVVSLTALAVESDFEGQVLFLLSNAETVNIVVPEGPRLAMPVFAPVATGMTVFWRDPTTALMGPIVLGNTKSTLSLVNMGSMECAPVSAELAGITFIRFFECLCACDPYKLPSESINPQCLYDPFGKFEA